MATIVAFITKYRNGLLAVIPVLIGMNWATGILDETAVQCRVFGHRLVHRSQLGTQESAGDQVMNWTTLVIMLSTAFLIVYDFFAIFKWGVTGTISYDIVCLTYRHPVVAFAGGMLCGHLFWNMNVTVPTAEP